MTKILTALIWLTVAIVVSAIAQTEKKPKPILLDVFGDALSECDLGARMDPFAVELQNNPDFTGFIILYKGVDQLPAEYDSQWDWAARFLEFYVRDRLGIVEKESERVKLSIVGFRENKTAEVWMVPKGAEPPKPRDLIPRPELPKNKTFLFERANLETVWDYLPGDLLLPKVKKEIYPENADYESYSKDEKEKAKFSWVNDSFGRVLKESRSLSGLIIFYADDSFFDISAVSKRISEGKRKIAGVVDVEPTRIKTIYGGYRDHLQAEFWIVSNKDRMPIPSPEKKDENDF